MTDLRISMPRKYEDTKYPSTFYKAWKSDNQLFIIIYFIVYINHSSYRNPVSLVQYFLYRKY